MLYNSTVRLHQLNLSELSGYILQFLLGSSGDTGSSGFFSLIGSGRTHITSSGSVISIGSDDYNLANSGDLVSLSNTLSVLNTTLYYPLNSGNTLSSQINNLNYWSGQTTGLYAKPFSISGNSGISVSINSNNILIGYTGGNNFVPISQFSSGTSTGFNFLYLKDNVKLLSSVFNQGRDFYFQGQESVNTSNPYIIDLYGSLATGYSLTSGHPFILGFDIYGGKITSSGNQVLTFADTGYYVTPTQLLATSGSLIESILRYRASGYGSGAFPDITNDTGNHRIGINQPNPQVALDVNGRIANTSGDLVIQAGWDNTLGTPSDLFLNADCGTNTVFIGDAGLAWFGGGGTKIDCSLGNIFNGAGGHCAYALTADATPSFVGIQGGNFGVGTTTPVYLLDVNGAIGNSSTLDFLFNVSSNPSFINANGGNFGVGTSSPAHTLDVLGDFNVGDGSDNIQIGSNIFPDQWIAPNGISFQDSTAYPNGIFFGGNNGVFGIVQWQLNFNDGGTRNVSNPGFKIQLDSRGSYGLIQFYAQVAGDPTSYYTLFTVTDNFNTNIGNGWGNGDVDVGTLYVKGDHAVRGSWPTLVLDQNTDGTSDIFQARSNAGTVLTTINSFGYVGVNRASPSYNLDVNGSGNFSSYLLVSGNNISTYFYPKNSNPTGYLIGTTGVLNISGNIATSLRTVSGNFTINSGNSILLINTTTSGSTGTCPNASGLIGVQFTFKDWKGNASVKNITITGVNSQTFDGSLNKVINTNYGTLKLVSDGSNWAVL